MEFIMLVVPVKLLQVVFLHLEKVRPLQNLVECWDKCLGEPEGEDELRTSHEELGGKTLEEGSETLVLGHTGDNSEAGLLGFKVAVLNTGLDNVKRCGDNERGGSTSDGSDEVLAPGGGVVVGELEEVFLGSGRTTEESERTRSVTSGSPAPTSVESKALIGDNSEDTTAAESLGVCLSLDLKDVEWQKDNLTNADYRAGSGVHDSLAIALAESTVERVAVVLGKVVAHKRLTTVLVHSLQDLVCCCVSKTGEQGEEATTDRGVSLVSEDDRVELGGRGNLSLVAHQSLSDGVDWVENGELSNTGRASSQNTGSGRFLLDISSR